MLRPLYTNKATRLLLIGPPSSGKRTLANQLLKSTRIFYTMHLLENFDFGVIDRVMDMDYVVLIVDMTNPASMGLLEQALQHLSPEYLVSRCSVVFSKVDMADLWMLNEDQIRASIHRYGNPMTFYVNLKDELTRKTTCDQLTRAICIGTFQQSKVHPLGMQFMDTYFKNNGNNIDSSKYANMDGHNNGAGLDGHNDEADLDGYNNEVDMDGHNDEDNANKSDLEEHNKVYIGSSRSSVSM